MKTEEPNTNSHSVRGQLGDTVKAGVPQSWNPAGRCGKGPISFKILVSSLRILYRMR